jgi:hypothetical protein
MLEPYEGKLSRTVLRGERGGNAPDLPGASNLRNRSSFGIMQQYGLRDR